MPPRRTHTKSRLGCTNCKRRKVKVCHCNSPSAMRSNFLGTIRARLRNGVASPADPVTMVMTNVSEQIAPFPPHELRSKDFELMHHYCTITADSLSIRRELQYVWRVVIPREGYRHPFVMHGILAIAAAHKAYLVPNNRKINLALSDYYQTVGSEGFRHTLQHNSSEARSALFCFASIVVLFMFTLPIRSENGRLEDPITSILELIRLLKGIRITQEPVFREIFKSEFAPIIYGIWPVEETGPPDRRMPLGDSILPLDTWDALGKLREFCKAEIPSASLKDYLNSIDRLEDTVKLVACAGVHVEGGAVLAWIYGVEESILVDIGAHRPPALLILSYYVVFLSTLEKNFWYCRGWGRQLTSEIETKVVGEPKCLELFQWPKQRIADMFHW
ncbi:hypothetical protein B0J13DRAFT_452073 [Dactylonectria estremocensis]|uniref:Zn(2)-C6 fungal-type domain-containing protein n=1 Tax=Dactylonectria estremocensis TaxID=1079267 RepID=A0A9P9IPA2_9HYPO|nr:hypothetical protein B0J13DRAFT_452073 [Dactylonectria estremocensis]